VADGEDGTREAARDLAKLNTDIKVIGEQERRGKGKGIRDGVSLALGAIIGFADADNKVSISEFEKVEPFLQQGIDVVVGSRALAQSQIEQRQPWYRRLGSRVFSYFLRGVLGMPGVKDTQCGFKFFSSHIARDLFARQKFDGYMFDVEILVLAQRLGYQIIEVPIRWRDDADSRLQLFSGNVQNVIDILRISMSSRRQRRVSAIDWL
jgi:dolichyl-phosphate beta-glucosyltransferase